MHNIPNGVIIYVALYTRLLSPTQRVLVLQRADEPAGLRCDGIAFNSNFAYIVYYR